MRDFQRDFRDQRLERKVQKRRRYPKLLLLVMFVAFILITKGVFSVYAKEKESRSEIARIEGERNEIQKRYEVIQEQDDALKSDTGVEAEIRSKFDVVRPGEGVIVIVEKDMPIIEEDKRGILKKFWDSVKGVFGGKQATSTNSADDSAKIESENAN